MPGSPPQARLTFTEWSTFFARMITAYLAADSDTEQRALGAALPQRHGLKRLDLTGQEVGYRVACECLRETVAALSDARGHYLAGGVAIARLLEMRALPFRVVFVCGMGEGLFPASDGPDPLDLLLRGRHHPGDVSLARARPLPVPRDPGRHAREALPLVRRPRRPDRRRPGALAPGARTAPVPATGRAGRCGRLDPQGTAAAPTRASTLRPGRRRLAGRAAGGAGDRAAGLVPDAW